MKTQSVEERLEILNEQMVVRGLDLKRLSEDVQKAYNLAFKSTCPPHVPHPEWVETVREAVKDYYALLAEQRPVWEAQQTAMHELEELTKLLRG